MAEKKDQNIFQGLLDVLRQQKGLDNKDSQELLGPVKHSFTPKGSNNREEVQQQFLDWQVQKIASDIYSRAIYFDTDRISAYQDFEAMDHSPEIKQALSIMRDECLTKNEYGEILQIYSDQERVKEVLKDLFFNKLNINFMLKLWLREMLKFGDYFVYLQTDKDQGVVNVTSLPVGEVHREEGYDQDLGAVRFRWEGSSNLYLEEWQVAHFRLLEDTKRLPYGRSVLDAARKTWKQLQLATDAMLTYRLTRAADRKVFYIEVGNLAEADVKQFMHSVQRAVKKAPVVDMRNGNKDFKYNPQNVTEDYFLPVRGEHHSKIDTLPGASNMDQISDLEFLENKLFCALVVPKAYLNYTEGLQGGTTLSQSDIRFARTINGFQEVVLMELKKIATVHLYMLGYKEDLNNFELQLNNPSTQLELMKLEIMKAQLEVGKEWCGMEANSPASWTWVQENIYGRSKNQIKQILKQKKIEKKLFAEIDSAPETYKKTGMFKDLDQKYEIAGADPNGGNASEEGGGEDGGFGGSSSLGTDGAGTGMGGDGGGGAPDVGGMDSGSSGAGGSPSPVGGSDAGGQSAPEMALGEGKISPQQRTNKSDDLFEGMMNELFEDDEKEERKKTILSSDKQQIAQSSVDVMAKTETLFRSLQNKFGEMSMTDRRKRKEMIKETLLTQVEGNPLLGDYNEQMLRLTELIDKVDFLPDDAVIEEQTDDIEPVEE